MLVGEPYFEEDFRAAGGVFGLLTRVMAGPREPASQRARRRRNVVLPAAFDAWFAKASARRPEDRFQRASAQAAALAEALGVPMPAPRASQPSYPQVLSGPGQRAARPRGGGAPCGGGAHVRPRARRAHAAPHGGAGVVGRGEPGLGWRIEAVAVPCRGGRARAVRRGAGVARPGPEPPGGRAAHERERAGLVGGDHLGCRLHGYAGDPGHDHHRDGLADGERVRGCGAPGGALGVAVRVCERLDCDPVEGDPQPVPKPKPRSVLDVGPSDLASRRAARSRPCCSRRSRRARTGRPRARRIRRSSSSTARRASW